MGRIIRRTVTITITESWTVVWSDEAQADETPPPPVTTVVQDQLQPSEEADETILPAVTTLSATEAPLDDGEAKPKAGSQRKHPRRRRRTGEQ